MANYRYLGYGITDENGIATLDHDANGNLIDHSYTGTGAGEIDIVASLDDNTHISERSIQSETCDVWDCIKYDSCTTTDSSKTTFDTLDANSRFTRYDEYGALTEVTSGTTALLKLSNLLTTYTVDFEVKQVDGANTIPIFAIYSGNTYKTVFTLSQLGIASGSWGKVRLTLAEGSATLTNIDDPTKTKTNTFTGTPNQLRLSTGDTNTEIQIRNLKIY